MGGKNTKKIKPTHSFPKNDVPDTGLRSSRRARFFPIKSFFLQNRLQKGIPHPPTTSEKQRINPKKEILSY